MNIKKLYLVLALTCATTFNLALAEENQDKEQPQNKLEQYQKIIDEYKAYVSTATPELRDEIIKYRKAVASLNKQKRALYSKLSQEAQEYMSKEQEFRSRLPVKKPVRSRKNK